MNKYLLERLKKMIKSEDIMGTDFKSNYPKHLDGYRTPFEVKKEIGRILKFSFMCFVLLFSCTVQKDQRAVSRIEANRTLLDQVFVEGLKLHPCANDTFTITKTRIDTTTVTNTVREVKNDTIYIKTTQYITRRDTVTISIIDKQQIGILNDTILGKVKIIEFQAGQLSAKDGQLKAQSKKEIWLYGIISGLLIFIVIYFGVKIYLSVSKVIPAI